METGFPVLFFDLIFGLPNQKTIPKCRLQSKNDVPNFFFFKRLLNETFRENLENRENNVLSIFFVVLFCFCFRLTYLRVNRSLFIN